MFMLSKLVQPLKHESPINSTLSGRVMLFRLSLLQKAQLPMAVTLSGMASSVISVNIEGITASVDIPLSSMLILVIPVINFMPLGIVIFFILKFGSLRCQPNFSFTVYLVGDCHVCVSACIIGDGNRSHNGVIVIPNVGGI